MKTNIFKSVFIILFLAALIVGGCSSNKPQIANEGEAGTGNQDLSEIDQLFGVPDQDKKTEQTPEEDEVLELLGIKKPATEEKPAEVVPQKDDQLQKELSDLERKLAQKDAEISTLKSDISSKEDKITQLESSSYKQQAQPASGYSSTGSFRDDYQAALNEYYNRNYKTAIQLFEELLAKHETNSFSDNCRYWIGESYYGLGNFNQAIIEFTKVFSFSKSNKADASQLKLGLCYWKLGDRVRARQEFERLVNDYPKSEYVSKAEQFLSKL
ncbi:MAG: tetratricopeptide repeat protein [bacterium]|jgi:tol-pal system protein YbgF|nr:tetratricopeptide repeat protein [bacterium]